jgi:hypothetical protein
MTLSGWGVGTGTLPSSASASAADAHTGAPLYSATACIEPAWSRWAWVMKIAARPRPATWRRIRRRAWRVAVSTITAPSSVSSR